MHNLLISARDGNYNVYFDEDYPSYLKKHIEQGSHFIIDQNVFRLYEKQLNIIPENKRTIVEAIEPNKSLNKCPELIEKLVAQDIKRDKYLVAIGGGIIQDLTCFIASTLFRGIKWAFFPTTLLAQSDSCIGSKSSINVGEVKNLVGTFYPPQEIVISTGFLKTLTEEEIRSGIGEILKIHIIAGQTEFAKVQQNFTKLFSDSKVLMQFILSSLEIKKTFAEKDEFDKGIRNILNYGHTFGHAIETATKYKIPHGIAVTFGMDVANYVAYKYNVTTESAYLNMHETLKMNYHTHENVSFDKNLFYSSIAKDKKNIAKKLALILPTGEKADIQKHLFDNDDKFIKTCDDFFKSVGFLKS